MFNSHKISSSQHWVLIFLGSIIILAVGNIFRLVTNLPYSIEYSGLRTTTQPWVIIGIGGAGEENSTIALSGVPALTNLGRTGETVKLLSGAADAVSNIRVLAVTGLIIVHKMVLAGDEPLNASAAVNVLVAGVLHGPLAVLSRTIARRLRLLQNHTSRILTSNMEGQHALLRDGIKHKPVLAQELLR